MEYLVVRACRCQGYELVDPYGKYVGCAPTFAHLARFADVTGAPLEFDAGVWAGKVAVRSLLERWFSKLRELVARISEPDLAVCASRRRDNATKPNTSRP